MGRALGGSQRHAAKREAAQQAFEAAVRAYEASERARQERVRAATEEHAAAVEKITAEVAAYNRRVDIFAQGVRDGDRHATSRYFQILTDRIGDPEAFPKERRVGFVPESSLLAVEWQLPNVDIVPRGKIFRYVKARDTIDVIDRPMADVRRIYQQLVAQMALRTLHVIFTADEYEIINTIVFNGYVKAIEPSTGQPTAPHLITLRATRGQFASLVLAQVDAVACVRRYFAADVSPHPEELQPVTPVMTFNMADPRIIDPVDVISDIDKRPNLLDLTSKEFEYFVQNLFARMGLDTKVFQADGDGGVDCIAYDPTPVLGGKYVIQAKLYNKTVAPQYVRDLYGTMQHEGATKGILITTSGYGPGSYDFANGKPLQLIDGSGLLALCHQYGIPARIVRTAGTGRKKPPL